jgi:hypothetical protein
MIELVEPITKSMNEEPIKTTYMVYRLKIIDKFDRYEDFRMSKLKAGLSHLS